MNKSIKSYPSSFIYLSLIFFSIIIIISSNNWFFTWMGMELSLFGFLPIFTFNQTTTEGLMKYFLMQASGSAMFLISCLSTLNNIVVLTILGMVMKLGIFPFFQWMPAVMVSLSWTGCMLLTTLQKVVPLLILANTNNPDMVFICSTLSIMISSVLGFNQSLMKPLMAYSSISFTSWIIMALWFNLTFGMLFIFFYFVLTLYLFSIFKSNNTMTIYQRYGNSKNQKNKNQSFMILSGMPPFSLFFFKMYMFYLMINMPLIMIILIVSTYISMYYYLRVAISSMPHTLIMVKDSKMGHSNFPNSKINMIHYLPILYLATYIY
uniref:NADH-ubiquinone oxidoreductase chain 2 n=1 Tax=Watersipora subtorquata TaxID=193294 RepID=C4MEF5_9BILA|nr:NADH dehydrogenase subunit 2 [Watersipora subtorquata]ABY55223.1 NADH dehydrogenase subunit 2 [Watersipora subtorquata]